jgi:hypothetical protein
VDFPNGVNKAPQPVVYREVIPVSSKTVRLILDRAEARHPAALSTDERHALMCPKTAAGARSSIPEKRSEARLVFLLEKRLADKSKAFAEVRGLNCVRFSRALWEIILSLPRRRQKARALTAQVPSPAPQHRDQKSTARILLFWPRPVRLWCRRNSRRD